MFLFKLLDYVYDYMAIQDLQNHGHAHLGGLEALSCEHGVPLAVLEVEAGQGSLGGHEGDHPGKWCWGVWKYKNL